MEAVLKNLFQGKISLPIAEYYADLNIANSIGPHKKSNKLGAVYYTLPYFPPEIQMLPELIFTAMIFHSKIREAKRFSTIC